MSIEIYAAILYHVEGILIKQMDANKTLNLNIVWINIFYTCVCL